MNLFFISNDTSIGNMYEKSNVSGWDVWYTVPRLYDNGIRNKKKTERQACQWTDFRCLSYRHEAGHEAGDCFHLFEYMVLSFF